MVMLSFASLFYFVDKNSTTFEHEDQVPDYINKVTPQFFCLVAIELIILYAKTSTVRINDTINSLSHWLLYTTVSASIRGVELVGYHWLYQRRLLDLNWNSPVTWWTAALGVDFGYYWVHRFVHEVTVGWAVHQVHHSSEDFTLTAGFRQHALQKCFNLGFYLPCALLGVPISALMVHLQLNLLYQFWIHTELVSTLGPLEWVLNTPSHHRVHHGSDPWCIDKNYGGVLIIWDKIFGTFEPERTGVKITYGIVVQPSAFNVLYLQTFYLKYVFDKAASTSNRLEYLKTLLYPPSWVVGHHRCYKEPFGYECAPYRDKYDPQLPTLLQAYVIGHFVMSLLIQQELMSHFHQTSWLSVLAHIVYLLVTLGNIGAIYDNWSGAITVETFRCLGLFIFSQYFTLFSNDSLNILLSCYSGLSAILWLLRAVGGINVGVSIETGAKNKQI